MQNNQRNFLGLKIALTLLGITLVSITVLSVVFYLNIHLQIQNCVNSQNCHQEQRQTPWIAPQLEKKYAVLELGESDEIQFGY
jgi:hypothetical protein